MKRFHLLIYAAVFLLTLSSCGSLSERGIDNRDLSSFRGEKVLLMEPLLLQDILEIETEAEIFEKNVYVGNIEFSGGVIRNEEKGMMVQTKNALFNRQTSYREKALLSFSTMIRTAADTEKYNSTYLERTEFENIAAEEREAEGTYGDFRFAIDYREHKDDGKDNINLPWYLFSPAGISPELTSRLGDVSGARYILVPVIEHYYSHSAGWFNDQWAGCGAGLRITYHIIIFDVSTGSTVFHFADTEKHLEEFSSRISEFLLFQEFTKIENRIQKTLQRKLPRG